MKAIILTLGIVAILGVGALWLYAVPQPAPAGPPTPARQANPSSSPSSLQQQASSVPATASSSRPLAITHTVGIATATPNLITVGTSTQVTVTIQITDTALIATSVNLLRLGTAGTQPTILGAMQSAGNGTYSLQRAFSEPAAGQIKLQVSAAFQGSLQRVLSNIVTVNVWNVLMDATSGFTILYPPTLFLTETPAPGIFFLESSPGGVAIGGAPLPGSSQTTSGFAVTISAAPYATFGNFDINQYLSVKYPNSVADVGSIASLSIGGQPGYEFTFQNEEGGGKPVAVVYHNGYAYVIRYAATDYIAGFSDQDGLNAFNAVLQNFSFNP
jgi:hypothetical protein